MNLKDSNIKEGRQKRQHKEKGRNKIYLYNPNISIAKINENALFSH